VAALGAYIGGILGPTVWRQRTRAWNAWIAASPRVLAIPFIGLLLPESTSTLLGTGSVICPPPSSGAFYPWPKLFAMIQSLTPPAQSRAGHPAILLFVLGGILGGFWLRAANLIVFRASGLFHAPSLVLRTGTGLCAMPFWGAGLSGFQILLGAYFHFIFNLAAGTIAFPNYRAKKPWSKKPPKGFF